MEVAIFFSLRSPPSPPLDARAGEAAAEFLDDSALLARRRACSELSRRAMSGAGEDGDGSVTGVTLTNVKPFFSEEVRRACSTGGGGGGGSVSSSLAESVV